MRHDTLIARVEEEDRSKQTFLVCSPAVGIVERVPARGSYVDPSRGFLTLRILGRRYSVRLPRELHGWVTERLIEDTFVPIEFGQPLLRLSSAQAPEAAPQSSEDLGTGAAEGSQEGLVPVRAPSQGVFYRRPNPESAPYVAEGGEVGAGTVLGLVEVMKCFHQIAYGGPGLPERGTVAKILVEDNAEVELGETLFLIRPLG